jgi:hypothetical protein
MGGDSWNGAVPEPTGTTQDARELRASEETMHSKLTQLITMAAVVAGDTEPPTPPAPGLCVDCGEPATCFGRSGMKCDKCCHDWCYPMTEPRASVTG